MSVIFLAGVGAQMLVSEAFYQKRNKASFGWAERRRWEGKEETDKFRDRPLPAAGLDFLLLIDSETLLAFLRKAMWIWGKKEKKDNPKCSISGGLQQHCLDVREAEENQGL